MPVTGERGERFARPQGAHWRTDDAETAGFATPAAAPGPGSIPASFSPDTTAMFVMAAERSRREVGELSAPAVTSELDARALASEMRLDAPADVTAVSAIPSGELAAEVAERAAGQAAEEEPSEVLDRADRSSNMVSVLVIISRLTGFLRTAAQAWAIGVTMFASCYTIADQLPNMLYEFVVGGMLVTSFLPVYVKVRSRLGREGASAYASNILSIITLFMVVLTVLSFIFAYPIIWTQSAGASSAFDTDMAVWLFRWFSVEIVLYALSSIFSGVLNAERDYLWSNAAPIMNNVVIIGAFALYGMLTRAGVLTTQQAMIFLAVGNPLGVAAQVLVQVPVLKRRGVRLSAHLDFHDPALRETLSIGLPTIIVVFATYFMFSVSSSWALSVTEVGAAVTYYANVWYVLPFSIFVIPISTTMFTELSNYFVAHDESSFRASFARGAVKILFTIVPFIFLFSVFSPYLVQIIAGGSFSAESAELTSTYLICLAVALPFYSLFIYLEKVCSAMLRMKTLAVATIVGVALHFLFCMAFTPALGLPAVAFARALFYGVIDLVVLVSVREHLGLAGVRSILGAVLRACVFGFLGAAVGWGICQGLVLALGPAQGTLQAILYAAAGGLPALVATFGVAYALGKSDAPFFDSIFGRVARRFAR